MKYSSSLIFKEPIEEKPLALTLAAHLHPSGRVSHFRGDGKVPQTPLHAFFYADERPVGAKTGLQFADPASFMRHAARHVFIGCRRCDADALPQPIG